MSTKERELVSSYEHISNGGVTTRLVEHVTTIDYSIEDETHSCRSYSQYLEFAVSCFGQKMVTRVPVSALSSYALRVIADQIDAHAEQLSRSSIGPRSAHLTILGQDMGYVVHQRGRNVVTSPEEPADNFQAQASGTSDCPMSYTPVL